MTVIVLPIIHTSDRHVHMLMLHQVIQKGKKSFVHILLYV